MGRTLPLVVILDLLVERSEFGHGGNLEVLRPFVDIRGGAEALLLTPQCQSETSRDEASAVATSKDDADSSESVLIDLDERAVPAWDHATPFIADRTVELGSGWVRLRRVALPTGKSAIGSWLESISPDAVVCSGSRRNVSQWESWMGDAADLLSIAVEIAVPTLGICFGHQLLCSAHGGVVERAEEGTHSIEEIALTRDGEPDPLISSVASCGGLRGLFTHQEHVTSLGSGTTILASAQHSEITAVRFDVAGDPRPAWGVQFHPEATEARIERALLLGHITKEEAHSFAGDHDGAALLASFATISLM